MMYDPITDNFTIFLSKPNIQKINYSNLYYDTEIPDYVESFDNNNIIIKNNILNKDEILSNISQDDIFEGNKDIRVVIPYENNNKFSNKMSSSKSFKSRLNKNQLNTALNLMKKLMSTDKDITPVMAAGIVGHMIQECSLDSTKYGKDVKQMSGGLILWGSTRFNDLKRFAANKNLPWTDVNTQVEFLAKELKNSYPGYYENALNAQSPSDAVEALSGYIKFAGWDNTLGSAKTWLKLLHLTDEEAMKKIMKNHESRQNYAEEVYQLWENNK